MRWSKREGRQLSFSPLLPLWRGPEPGDGRNVSTFWSFDNILGTKCNQCSVVVVVCYSRVTGRTSREMFWSFHPGAVECKSRGLVSGAGGGEEQRGFLFPPLQVSLYLLSQFCIELRGVTCRDIGTCTFWTPSAPVSSRSPAVASFRLCVADFSVSPGPSPAAYKNDLM